MLEVEFVKFDSFKQNCTYSVSVFYGIYEIDQPHLAGPLASRRLPVEHTRRGYSLVRLCFKWHLVLETANKYAGTMPAASPHNLPAQAQILNLKTPNPIPPNQVHPKPPETPERRTPKIQPTNSVAKLPASC